MGVVDTKFNNIMGVQTRFDSCQGRPSAGISTWVLSFPRARVGPKLDFSVEDLTIANHFDTMSSGSQNCE